MNITRYITRISVAVLAILSAAVLISSCHTRNTSEPEGEEAVVGQDKITTILEQMKSDPEYKQDLDSMAICQIGEGAETIDILGHVVKMKDRLFLYNPDWGTTLEIPSSIEWKPEISEMQAILSFHGTTAWSADSLVLLSYYGGFQALPLRGNSEDPDLLTKKEYIDMDIESLENQGFKVLSVKDMPVKFGDVESIAFITRAKSDEGINYYRKEIYEDHNHVNHSATVQWPDGYDQRIIDEIIRYFDNFPFGPDGQLPNGYCL